MIKLILNSFLFKMALICVIAALVFLGIGYAIEAMAGKMPVCELYQA